MINKFYSILFIFAIPLFGNLISPENNQTIFSTHIRFKWRQIPNATYYNLVASSFDSFSSINIIDSTLNHIDKNTFGWNENIHWQVYAYDSTGININQSEVFTFQTGSQKFPDTELLHNDSLSMNGGITIFGIWYDWASGAIGENGNEIWNDGDLSVMINHIDEHGQMFGSQAYDYDNVPVRGIQFDIDHRLIWEEPLNMRLDPHDLKRVSNGDILSLKATSQLGPIPIGPWQEHYQSLGYQADGEINEIQWSGQKIMLFDHITNQVEWEWDPFEHYAMDDVDLYQGTWWWAVGWGYDWLHSNSIYFDENNSDIYYSSRHISRISKIQYPSGEVEWMMGLPETYMPSGDVHLCNDLLFSFQHDAKILPNGNLMFYDNGNMSTLLMGLNEPRSRILEIAITEEDSCDVVWEYILPEDLFAIGMGSTQLLDNGNIQITSGNQCGTVLEISRDHEIAWQARLGLDDCENSLYKAYRVTSLYPKTFSLLVDNYSYIDAEETQQGVKLRSDEYLGFKVYNEGDNNLDFFYSLSEIINDQEVALYDSVEFMVESMDRSHVSIPLNILDPGVHLIKLNVKTRPYYRDGEPFVFFVLIEEGLGITNNGRTNAININENYPNPFNAQTTINYVLQHDSSVKITLYDMKGRVVKNLAFSNQKAGRRSIRWNATNDAGSPVSAGLYLYMIQAGEFRQTKKMVLLK